MSVSKALPSREEYLRKKRNRRILKYSLVFLFIIFLIALVSYVAHRPELRIAHVELSGGVLVEQNAIEAESLYFMEGSHVFLFPKNNAFWYPKKTLAAHLLTTFKRIDTIQVSRKNLTTLSVEITERKPVATWCDAVPGSGEPSGSATERERGSIEASTPRCYFLDLDGRIFAEAPYFSGSAYFKYYGPLISTSTPIGNQYLVSSTEFAEIENFITEVKNMSVHPLYLVAKEDDQFSLVVQGGGEIYFDLKEPLSKVLSNFEALLRTPMLSTTTNYNLPIQYIDLRFGNKLFYKLKGE